MTDEVKAEPVVHSSLVGMWCGQQNDGDTFTGWQGERRAPNCPGCFKKLWAEGDAREQEIDRLLDVDTPHLHDSPPRVFNPLPVMAEEDVREILRREQLAGTPSEIAAIQAAYRCGAAKRTVEAHIDVQKVENPIPAFRDFPADEQKRWYEQAGLPWPGKHCVDPVRVWVVEAVDAHSSDVQGVFASQELADQYLSTHELPNGAAFFSTHAYDLQTDLSPNGSNK